MTYNKSQLENGFISSEFATFRISDSFWRKFGANLTSSSSISTISKFLSTIYIKKDKKDKNAKMKAKYLKSKVFERNNLTQRKVNHFSFTNNAKFRKCKTKTDLQKIDWWSMSLRVFWYKYQILVALTIPLINSSAFRILYQAFQEIVNKRIANTSFPSFI